MDADPITQAINEAGDALRHTWTPIDAVLHSLVRKVLEMAAGEADRIGMEAHEAHNGMLGREQREAEHARYQWLKGRCQAGDDIADAIRALIPEEGK